MGRPPIAEERLSVEADGLLVLELERAVRDGTPHVLFMACLRRVSGIDIDRCPRCAGEVRVIATVTEPGVIAPILHHLRRAEHPATEPRGPPPLAA
jgi:hypothetical protein